MDALFKHGFHLIVDPIFLHRLASTPLANLIARPRDVSLVPDIG
jgi:hypothetical protein